MPKWIRNERELDPVKDLLLTWLLISSSPICEWSLLFYIWLGVNSENLPVIYQRQRAQGCEPKPRDPRVTTPTLWYSARQLAGRSKIVRQQLERRKKIVWRERESECILHHRCSNPKSTIRLEGALTRDWECVVSGREVHPSLAERSDSRGVECGSERAGPV